MNESSNLMKALMIGALLAGAAVGLFLLMYFVVLGSADNVARLFISLLVPPLLMGVAIGAYYLFSKRTS
jgi:hypothetical protein